MFLKRNFERFLIDSIRNRNSGISFTTGENQKMKNQNNQEKSFRGLVNCNQFINCHLDK